MPTHIPSRQATEDESFRTIINEYRDFLSHQAMAPSSIESYLRRSRHFLVWLSRNGLGLSEVDGEVSARFQTHDCTCFGRPCARPKHSPARTPGSSPSRVMWFVRFLELSGRASTPGELEGNLALVPAFLHELRRQGYTQSRIDRFRYGATAFIARLHLSRMRLRDINAGTLERFHHRRFACSIPGICWGRRSEKGRGYRPDIRRFLDYLADTGQIEPWRPALGTHGECFASFRVWLARTRDISARSIQDHIKQIQAVLPALGEAPESYDAALIRRVMLAHLERGSRARARVLATSLRMYLRFLAFEGHVPAALVGAVPSLPVWSLSTLPRHIPVEDIERAIESCDTATPAGMRDRAALLLLARLALRAGDVVALRLTDIDWDRALLRGQWQDASRHAHAASPGRGRCAPCLHCIRPPAHQRAAGLPGRQCALPANQRVRRRERDRTQSVRSWRDRHAGHTRCAHDAPLRRNGVAASRNANGGHQRVAPSSVDIDDGDLCQGRCGDA